METFSIIETEEYRILSDKLDRITRLQEELAQEEESLAVWLQSAQLDDRHFEEIIQETEKQQNRTTSE